MAQTYPIILLRGAPLYNNDIRIRDTGDIFLDVDLIYIQLWLGKPAYQNAAEHLTVEWQTDHWEIRNDAGIQYISYEDTFFPWQVTEWEAAVGNPLYPPTVTEITGTGSEILGYAEIEFNKEDIREATVIEEYNPLSIVLPVNKFEVLLYSENADFSILNPAGNYASLSRRAPLMVYEMKDGSIIPIGRYYLDDWENVSDTLIRFTCMDDIGILDGLTYKGGIWLTPITMGDLLAEIFTSLNIAYELDPNLENTEITGWIPICSYREAIQQIAFACGAYVMCARQDGIIKIGTIETAGIVTKGIRAGVSGYTGSTKTTTATQERRVWQKRWRQAQWEGVEAKITIPLSEQAIGVPVDLRAQVTGVEIVMHDIVVGEGTKKLFEGTLDVGEYEIEFNQPMHSLTITGATITESGANYAKLNVATAGEVTLSGSVYVDTTSTYSIYLPEADIMKPNVLKIEDASLVNSANGRAIAQRVFDYYQERHVITPKLFAPSVHIGSPVLVDALYNQRIDGIVEKMDVDLANGFTAVTTIIGTKETT